MKKLLILSYYFPPMGYIGVQRALRFSKYLPKLGWESHVLTVKNVIYEKMDAGLLSQFPDKEKIYRSGSIDPLRILYLLSKLTTSKFRPEPVRIRSRFKSWSDWLLIPDNKIGWLPFAILKALKVIRKEKINAILSTGPPFTSHIIGAILRKLTGKPLILDYRDPWTMGTLYRFPTRVHCRISVDLQNFCLKSTSDVIVVNEGIIPGLRESNVISENRIHFVPNGYDAEDFKEAGRPAINNNEKMNIVYGGRLYDKDQLKRFVFALRKFCSVHNESRCMELRLLGTDKIELNDAIKDDISNQIVKFEPYLSNDEYCKALQHADLLWLTVDTEEGNTRVPGKLYNYLGAGKPILATVPENSVAAKIVNDAHAGVVIEPQDTDGIVKALEGLYDRWERGEPTPQGMERKEIEQYEYSHLTVELVKVLDKKLCSEIIPKSGNVIA